MGKSPADLIRAVGEALYGERWQSDFCRALRVNSRTVRRWAAGDIKPPSAVWDSIERLCQDRADAILSLKRSISTSERSA